MTGLSEDELRWQIDNFLKDFKALMAEGAFYFKHHLKTLMTLKDLEITEQQAQEAIKSLTLADFSRGPLPDQLHPGEYWEFGKDLAGGEIYIKLKIVTRPNGNEKAVCISFHPSEHPMKYRFRP